MTDQQILTRLNVHLKDVCELLALGDLGLLTSDELHTTKCRIEDDIQWLAQYFDKIESLKIKKAIPIVRNTPKSGMFLTSQQVNSDIQGLHILILDLIKVKGGSEQVTPVVIPELQITGSTINQAIADAKTLLGTQGATSALDRIHTVLHGYLKQVCMEAGILYPDTPTLNQLFNLLKENHPALAVIDKDVVQILKNTALTLDKLNPLRNSASLAHSNPILLKADEAMFVINSANSILAYLNTKFNK